MTTLVLDLPEPPSLNAMIDLAKQRTRRSRTGGWMKRTLPVVYDQEKERYELACTKAVREAGVHRPPTAWPRWRLERAAFRLHNLRDPLELMAGLKWAVDWLVLDGWVEDDSDAHLIALPPKPEQVIDRKRRGVTLTITAA